MINRIQHMESINQFLNQLTPAEKKLVAGLDSPRKIQDFLDEVIYPGGEENRSAIEVLRLKKAHCLDGGLFAAGMLRLLGFEALILDLLPEPGKDDDHVLALYRINGCWGAIAKSNFSGLRFREAIHRSLRELVISYFEDSFNIKGEKTLRYYSRPIHLSRFDRVNWMTESKGVDVVEKHLKQGKLTALVSPDQAASLSLVDRRAFNAGTLGLNYDGVFQPDENHEYKR